jgi:hypothetical protein
VTDVPDRVERIRGAARDWARFWDSRLDLDALGWEVTEQLPDLAAANDRVRRATGQATTYWERLYGDDPLLVTLPGMRPVAAPTVRAFLGDGSRFPTAKAGKLRRTGCDPGRHCHTQATIAVARKLAELTWTVLHRGVPYQLQDPDGQPITPREAKTLISHNSARMSLRRRSESFLHRGRRSAGYFFELLDDMTPTLPTDGVSRHPGTVQACAAELQPARHSLLVTDFAMLGPAYVLVA